jgi:hypothetical protein
MKLSPNKWSIGGTVGMWLFMWLPLSAQWITNVKEGIPRTTDGKPNLSAPAPRTADGKPDLSGVWETIRTTAVDVPFQPWAQSQANRDRDNLYRDNPGFRCLPPGPGRNVARGVAKFIQTPELVVILYDEGGGDFRQVFLDGRRLIEDPNPTWRGYSVGRWEGDTLVVDTTGFNDRVWLNINGLSPHSEALHVIERYRRLDFGHMELQMTIDDSKTYTKAWTVTATKELRLEDEILEYVCLENERDSPHIIGK